MICRMAGGVCLVAAWSVLVSVAAAEIPFPAALDGAAVSETTLTDIDRNGLVLGNGDLTGLLWERGGAACIRVTKNDLWDARIDTSEDTPLWQIDVPNQKWPTGRQRPVSYGRTYPQPRCGAVIVIGPSTPPLWRCIGGQRPSQWLKVPTTLTRLARGAHRLKLTPITPSLMRRCAPRRLNSLGRRPWRSASPSAGRKEGS